MRNYTNIGLTVLRVGISLLMMTHGYGKLQMLLSGEEIQFMSFMGLSPTISLILTIIGELIAPIFIIIGFKTRLASLFPVVTMAVAAFMVHGNDPLAKQEMSLLYLIAFIAIGLLGAGKFSLDGRKV
ncbi:DoxX family protein [Zhouia spongiae]|uniref:DoxX family protein n=1 Tax=Zhouia spongiae TaxID=2202721 RepID=A0ABY3YK03_9FLAO|nr:DoxX family protein [Zhouia spongiae]UNY98174.1 DoxX family protein [Zhouia spongiae]